MPVNFTKQQKKVETAVDQENASSVEKPTSLKAKFELLNKKKQETKEVVKNQSGMKSNMSTHGQLKPSFLKKGKDAQAAMEKEQQDIEQLKKSLWRYYMNPGDSRLITFLDGNLDANSNLDCPMWWEHNVYMNGTYGHWFVCVKELEPCPICEMKDQYSSIVAGFTIIDHSEYISKKKPGTIIKDQVKLFVCKRNTFKLLQQLAVVHNGLAGCTFEVERTTENSASVGDNFQFLEKNSLEDLQAEFGTDEKLIVPANFGEQVVYRSAEELRAMGFGLGAPIGADSKGTNYQGHL